MTIEELIEFMDQIIKSSHLIGNRMKIIDQLIMPELERQMSELSEGGREVHASYKLGVPYRLAKEYLEEGVMKHPAAVALKDPAVAAVKHPSAVACGAALAASIFRAHGFRPHLHSDMMSALEQVAYSTVGLFPRSRASIALIDAEKNNQDESYTIDLKYDKLLENLTALVDIAPITYPRLKELAEPYIKYLEAGYGGCGDS